jgi:hypothetical protein
MEVCFTAVAKGCDSAAKGSAKGLEYTTIYMRHVIVFMLGSCACIIETADTAVATVEQ